MDAATSFASRRPAAGGLPHFQLPPPNPHVDAQVPRNTGSDGLSPLSSGVNSGSSQSSQAGIPPYNPTGSWPVPGNQSYTFSTMNSAQPTLMQSSYGGRPLYSPSNGAYNPRSSHSPATGDGLAAPPYDNVPPPFPVNMGGSGSNSSSMLPQPHSALGSHNASASSHSSSSAQSHNDNYSRPPPTPSYYQTPSSTPQQQSFPAYASSAQTSPTTTGGLSRGIPALSASQPSPMQAPPYYGGRGFSHSLSSGMGGGAVLSNMTNPGGQMQIVGNMPPLPHHSYSHMPHHPHMYGGQPQPQQDRPFKCDVCPQSFNRNHDLKRHKRIHLAVKPFPCNHCDKSFSRKDALKRHRLVKGCGNGKTSPSADDEQDGVKAEHSDGASVSGKDGSI